MAVRNTDRALATTTRLPGGALPDVVLDCRWLDFWGAGRVTELLLRGLAADPPPGHWHLWGPPSIESMAWDGASASITTRDPRQWRGQRPWFEMPRGRLTVFMHQQRPLRNVPSIGFILDTIPLHHARSPAERVLRTAFLRRAASVSREILTISEYSRGCIRDELRVPGDRVTVMALPHDMTVADRVAARRRVAPAGDFALFVGRFAAHKNLTRLRAAFARTAFRAAGGRLVLLGGSPREAASLQASLDDAERQYVEVRGRCDDAGVEAAMATCRFLVQPSLDEGYGLPVVEAMAAGVTVCVSDGGALPEITRDLATPFPATSTDAMVAALDEAARAANDQDVEARLAARLRARTPTPRQFALSVRAAVERNMPSPNRPPW